MTARDDQVAVTRVEVLHQLDHLEENTRVGIDVGYAVDLLNQAVDHYIVACMTDADE